MNSRWIWNKGDFELYHANLVNSRRQEYGMDYPTFWKLYDVEKNVKMFAEAEIERDGAATLYLNGKGYWTIDGKMYPSGTEIPITAGKHSFGISVMNMTGIPAAYIESDVLATDGNWYTVEKNAKRVGVGYNENYRSKDDNPDKFKFAYKKIDYVNREKIDGGILYDFGKEMFGFLYISGVLKNEKIHVSYGESREEALDTEWSIVREDVSGSESYRLVQRAFRYIYITGTENPDVYAEAEYLPLERKGSFECNEQAVNDIWNMCAYTLMLNAREVYTEAIKRDRWLWGGDAYQEFKFNKYLFFDKEIEERSIIGLRGKDPVTEHINTITDYSLFWFISVWEYYMAYKDEGFVKFIYPRAVTLMDFCRDRTDDEGFIVGKYDDWVFVDWSEIDKSGAVCAEQMLYVAALKAMYELSRVAEEENGEYLAAAERLEEKINRYFWKDEVGAYTDNYKAEKASVTRHANIFAVMYGIADKKRTQSIVENVLLNDKITKITTPYFEGYELDVMGMVGNTDYIHDMLLSYWKGMMDLGATTVWEEYNPELSGAEHYAMYGNKYGKSLCHAWGASPIYLLGKYYLGVTESSAGFETFTVKPDLGRFEYIKGTVPIKDGSVNVFLSKEKLSVKTDKAGGTLVWNGKEYELKPDIEFVLQI